MRNHEATRYPGYYEPVEMEEYLSALKTAENVVSWVRDKLEEKS